MIGPLKHPYWRFRFHSFGARSIIHDLEWLRGAHQIAVGEDVVIFRAWLATEQRVWRRSEPALRIGDRCIISPRSMINAAESVVIEDDVAIGTAVLIVDSDHTTEPFDQIAFNPLKVSPVRIGRGTALGNQAAVLAGSTIGRNCFIGTNSVVHGDIPDYSVAVGAPARVIGHTSDAERSPPSRMDRRSLRRPGAPI